MMQADQLDCNPIDESIATPRRHKHGATAIEYTMIMVAIAGAIVAAVFGTGNSVSGLFQAVVTNFPGN